MEVRLIVWIDEMCIDSGFSTRQMKKKENGVE